MVEKPGSALWLRDNDVAWIPGVQLAANVNQHPDAPALHWPDAIGALRDDLRDEPGGEYEESSNADYPGLEQKPQLRGRRSQFHEVQ